MSPKPPAPDDDERIVEEIYDALDEGDAEKALARAKIALHELGDDPVLRFLAGQAYLELDRPDDAAKELKNAVALDPEDPEFRASLALALFRSCRFADAPTGTGQAESCAGGRRAAMPFRCRSAPFQGGY